MNDLNPRSISAHLKSADAPKVAFRGKKDKPYYEINSLKSYLTQKGVMAP